MTIRRSVNWTEWEQVDPGHWMAGDGWEALKVGTSTWQLEHWRLPEPRRFRTLKACMDFADRH